jgi:hypothetical protein
MGEKMSREFSIDMQWENLSEGSPEERACFGMLRFLNNGIAISEGIDGFVNCSRQGPLVSGYPLAEWLAWNWWRLTGEPRREHSTSDWAFAHRLSTIGEGYLWPNITIFSDRERTVVIAKPTQPKGFSAFRFTTDYALVLPSRVFETAVELFLGQIQGRLREKAIPETNFDRIWAEICVERRDSNLAARRRIEALLGIEPDEGDQAQVEQLLADAGQLGSEAVQELAASQVPEKHLPTAEELTRLAEKQGAEARSSDRMQLEIEDLPPCEQVPAWQRGYQAADALRKKERLGYKPINNRQLAEMCGVSEQILSRKASTEQPGFSFSLESEGAVTERIVLRSKWQPNRRFNLARLLGDKLTSGCSEPLSPATDTYTYRQKLQRAFAAELLCPFEALEDVLRGDYSPEAREDAANHFKVSERTVTTLLVNHKRLDRDFLEDEAA